MTDALMDGESSLQENGVVSREAAWPGIKFILKEIIEIYQLAKTEASQDVILHMNFPLKSNLLLELVSAVKKQSGNGMVTTKLTQKQACAVQVGKNVMKTQTVRILFAFQRP